MSRVRTASLLVFATALSATGLAAEAVTQRGAGTQSAPPGTPATRPVAPRAISPETAAKLNASAPKFVATPPINERAVAAPDESKELENVKPRNTIIRLPEYVVRDPKVPQIKEREVLTPSGRLALARKRNPGIRVGNLFGLNNGVALAMLAEEERLERKREFEDLASLTRLSDPANHPKIKRQVEQAFMRERDFGR
jgi:hypothetical protein